MNKEDIEIIKSTIPFLKENGVELAKRFYENLFEGSPEVKNFFSDDKQKSGEQAKSLAMMVLSAAQNIENLEKLMPSIDRVSKVHTKSKIKPEHYPIVGKYLLLTIREMLEENNIPENDIINILNAWEKAYGILSNVFINVEKNIYEENS